MRGGPFLRRIVLLPDETRPDAHPFDIPAFRAGIDLALRTGVTFFVGENGSGKSTLLEAVAKCCGFNPETLPPARLQPRFEHGHSVPAPEWLSVDEEER
jgi:DNA repair ATPase RecN